MIYIYFLVTSTKEPDKETTTLVTQKSQFLEHDLLKRLNFLLSIIG